MTARPLDFAFLPMADLSRRPPWSIDIEEQEAELGDELASRRDRYPAMVAKGRGLTQRDADRHILVLGEILADCRLLPDDRSPAACARTLDEARDRRREMRILWEDKIRELRREITIRRNGYPGWIDKGRVTLGVAREKMERIEAVHWRYWMTGFVWDDCLLGRDRVDRARLFRDFHVPRIEWQLQQLDANARWADPAWSSNRAWSEAYCRQWRAERAADPGSLDKAA